MLDFVELLETRVRNDEVKFVVLFEAADRDQNIRRRECAGDFGQRHLERLQFVWIDSDAVFFDAPALNTDTRNALNSGKSGPQCVQRQIAQLDQRMRIGSQTVADHREHSRIHALDFE